MDKKEMQLLVMISSIMVIVLTTGFSQAFENLGEMTARISRRGTNTYFSGATAGNNYVRQAESLSYKDIKTGHEVWILSNTANEFNSYHGEISPANPWSADGKRLGFFSSKSPKVYSLTRKDSFGGGTAAYIVRSDGSYHRETLGASQRGHNFTFRFFTWSPSQPDIYYAFGENGNGLALDYHDLYCNQVSDTDIVPTKLANLPNLLWCIYKTINPSGTHLVLSDSNKEVYLPIQVLPTVSLLSSYGWSYNRGQGSDYGGGYEKFHDLVFPDPYGKWFIHMVGGGYGTFWKLNLTGFDPDGGPHYTRGAPLNFWNSEQCEPIWTRNPKQPHFQSNNNWWGHPGFDRWGKKVASGQGRLIGGLPDGSDAVWDYTTRRYENSNSKIGYAAHRFSRSYTDWSAWSDYVSGSNNDGLNTHLFVFHYKKRERDRDFWLVANHHGNQNSSTSYEATSYARQTQSPDGTKIAYEVSFLNNTPNKLDIAFAVAYYPYPPEITEASISEGVVSIHFDWRLDQDKPRGYTKRGWPDESTDIPPAPREIKQFRLWRSSDRSNWMPLSTVDHDIFRRFDFARGGFKTGQNRYWEITDKPGAGIWYYGVTSIEWSGLESRTLSNIWKVLLIEGNIKNGGEIGEQALAYPTRPGGINRFYKKSPSSPTGLTFRHKQPPAIFPGQYTLTWNNLNDPMVRYYNIYANDGSAPTTNQKNRIASIPITSFKGSTCLWVDWLGNQDGNTYYVITAVDYQGNESK